MSVCLWGTGSCWPQLRIQLDGVRNTLSTSTIFSIPPTHIPGRKWSCKTWKWVVTSLGPRLLLVKQQLNNSTAAAPQGWIGVTPNSSWPWIFQDSTDWYTSARLHGHWEQLACNGRLGWWFPGPRIQESVHRLLGITLLELPGKVCARLLESPSVSQTSDSRGTMWFSSGS